MVNNDVRFFADISKIDEEQRMVWGTAQTDSVDNQDEIVEWEATKNAIPEYEKWRNLREMHTEKAVGIVPEIEIRDDEKQLYIGAKVVDDGAWNKVKEGVYKGFSIGGKALERLKEFDTGLGKTISRVKKYVLNEISLVDRPANPDCIFEMMKRDDDELPSKEDPLSKDVDILRKMASSLDKKILSKKQMKNLPDESYALIKKVDGEKKRLYPMPDKSHAMALLKQLMKLKVTDRERHVIHEKIKKTLGNKHSLNNCEYCREYLETLRKIEGGENIMMDKQKLLQAKALIEELLSGSEEMGEMGEEMGEEEPVEEEFGYDEGADFEGQSGDDSLGAETEDIVPSPKKDETSNISELQGSKYSDKEGADFEGWDGEQGYETGLEEDENRTHLYDDEGQRRSKAEMEGAECPYCGSTLKALMSGTFRKNSAVCPGCGTEYAVNASPKVTIAKRGNRRRPSRMAKRGVRKSFGTDPRIAKALGTITKVVQGLDARLDEIEGQPQPRKSARRMSKGGDEENTIAKASTPEGLQADIEKGVSITKAANAAGRTRTPDEDAFCNSVLERSLQHKAGLEDAG